jgi:acetolactate synthase I/II/III large subunit
MDKKPISDISDVEKTARDLQHSERPVILIGKGIRSAGADILLRQFVENWNLPVTYSTSAPDIYGTNETLSIGSVGVMGCSRAGNFTIQNADYVLVLGSRLNSLTTGTDYSKFARSARITVVDIDPLEHSKSGVKIDRLIEADLFVFLSEILKQHAKPTSTTWVNKCLHWKNLFPTVEPAFMGKDNVDLHQLADALSRLMPDGSTLVTDSGLIEVILPGNVRFKQGMDCIHPASQGTMGFALPASIGAAYSTENLVLAVIGDGSIMMNLQELQSIRYQRLPIKIIIINNNVYSIIRKRQRELFRTRTIGTDPDNGVSCPDFSKIANCFGLNYQRIETEAELDEGLKELFSSNESVLCEIMGCKDQAYIQIGYARSENDGRFVRRPLEDQETIFAS